MNILTQLSYPGLGSNIDAEPAPNLALDYNPYFFAIKGQSNAAGVGSVSGATGGSGAINNKVTIWNNLNRRWEVFEPGVNTRGTTGLSGTGATDVVGGYVCGVEAKIMKRMTNDFPTHQKYMFKYCVSNTTLGTDATHLEWLASNPSELFYRASSTYSNAMRGMRNPKPPRFLIWMQGENDGQDSTRTAAYEANLNAFIAAERSFFGYTIPFIIVGTGNNQTAVDFRVTMKATQQAVVAANSQCYFIDTDGFAVNSGDDIHFTITGIESIANAIYDSILIPNNFLPPD